MTETGRRRVVIASLAAAIASLYPSYAGPTLTDLRC